MAAGPQIESNRNGQEGESRSAQAEADSTGVVAPSANERVRHELIFIDGGAADYQQLVDDIVQQEDESRQFEIVVLDGERDGVEQVTSALAERSELDAIHIVSHGSEGAVNLGDVWLTADNLDGYASDISAWQDALSDDADLMIYGCDLAATEDGKFLTAALGVLTGADVAASVDDTGQVLMGGNWEFEFTTGKIETDVAFSVEAQQNWWGLLNPQVDATSTGTTDASSITISHTTTGSERMMLVGFSFGKAEGDHVDSVTYNGDSLNFVGAYDDADGKARVEIWSLVAPDLGTHDVVVDFSAAVKDGVTVGVTTFTGVDQSTPIDNLSFDRGDSRSPSTTVAATSSDLVYGVVALKDKKDDYELQPGTGQTELWDLFIEKANGAASVELGSASTDVSWTYTEGKTKWAVAGLTIKDSPTNLAPTLTSFSAAIDAVPVDTEAELTFAELLANSDADDSDGTVESFVVQTVSSGTLRIGATAASATAWVSGSNDTIDSSNHAYWTPAAGATGLIGALEVVALDNDGALSVSSATAQVNVVALPEWSVSGGSSVTEGGQVSYTISLGDLYPGQTSASVDLALADVDTTSADYTDFIAAVDAAVAARSDLTFDGTTLTYDATTTDYTATYNPTGGGFVDISNSGSVLSLGDDTNALANIGFDFDFYGSTETQLRVSDNGYVTFNGGTNQPSNVDMSSGSVLGGRPGIAALWDDYDPTANGDAYVQTTGAPGNREFIVQWNNIPFYGGGTTETGTFQLVLHEGSNEIEVRYADTDFAGLARDDGLSATIGIQDGSGQATQYSFNTASVIGGSTITFSPPSEQMTPLLFTLETVSDNLSEADEDFNITLSNATDSSVLTAAVTTTIVDDDPAPIATDNTNDVTEDVVLNASGNLITDDDGFGVDWVRSTTVQSVMSWADEFGEQGVMSDVTMDGVTASFDWSDPDGIATANSFKVNTINPLGNSNSYALLQVNGGPGEAGSRIDFSWSFDEPVGNLEFEIFDFDDGHPNWGDDSVITAYNGTTEVPVIITPNNPSRYIIDGGHIRSNSAGNVGGSSTAANFLIQVAGPVTELRVDYGYTQDVTVSNPSLQNIGIGDPKWERINQAAVSEVGGITDASVDIVGTYGTLNWNADGTYDYTLDNSNPAVQGLAIGESLTDDFDYTIQDIWGNSDTGTLAITINGTNDVPTTSNKTVSTAEDVEFTFALSDFAFADVDDNDTFTQIKITSLESSGTLQLDGVNVVLGQLISVTDIGDGQLTFLSELHDSGTPHASFDFQVFDGSEFSAASTISVDVTAVADTPILVTPPSVTIDEDNSIALGILTGLVDVDGSETLNVTIKGMVEGATLTDGTNSFTATSTVTGVDVTSWNVAAISITPPADSDGEFTLTVSANAAESSNGNQATSVATINVVVNAVADAPTVSTPASVTVNEDGTTAALGIVASLNDTDGSETLAVVISGIVEGATITDGTNSFTGTAILDNVDVTNWSLVDITVTPPPHSDTEFQLQVTATSTETNPTSIDTAVTTLTAQTSSTIDVRVDAVADAPSLTVTSTATGDEDGSIALAISSSLVDTDSSESLSIEISGVPVGATLSAGTNNGGGSWTLTSAQLAGLTITPPAHSDAEFQLTVTATASETSPTSGDTTVTTLSSSTSATIDVQVDAVADAPTLNVTAAATGDEDSLIALDDHQQSGRH